MLQIPLVRNRLRAPEYGDGVASRAQYAISYRFLHDRVQQAAYSLIPDSQKKQTHLKIGFLLLNQPRHRDSRKYLWYCQPTQYGVESSQSGKAKWLAKFNLLAGKKAKSSAAYWAALKYFNVGLELLPEKAWQSHYNLIMQLHIEALQSSYINTILSKPSSYQRVVVLRAKKMLEKIKVYELKVIFHFNQINSKLHNRSRSFENAGVAIPKKPNKLMVLMG